MVHLIMVLATDMILKDAVGTFASLVGFGDAMGGVLPGQLVGWMRNHGSSYTLALCIAGSLNVAAYALICVTIPKIQPLKLK